MFCLVQKDPQIGSAITFEVRLVCLFSTSTNDLLNMAQVKLLLSQSRKQPKWEDLGTLSLVLLMNRVWGETNMLYSFKSLWRKLFDIRCMPRLVNWFSTEGETRKEVADETCLKLPYSMHSAFFGTQ